MKTILLTGATGFLGSHLLKCLINSNFRIIVLKRSFSDIYRIKNELKSPNVESYNIDEYNLEGIFEKNKIDTIIHCATEYGRKDNTCYKVLETNLMFPVELLEYAIKYEVTAFINTDSYFNKENMSYSYLLNYSLSKKSLNLWLKYFSKKIKIVNIILEHIYGPCDNSDKFVEKMIRDIAIEQKAIVNLTNGDQKRDFIYIDDVCKVYLTVLEYIDKNKFHYKSFDVGTGISTSIKDFVSIIKQISNSSSKLNFGTIPYREDEIMCSYADIVELTNLVDVNKFINYKDGIDKIIKIYKG